MTPPKPIIKTEITGFLPITPEDAEVLEYMTNISAKHYADTLGSKFTAERYTEVLGRVRDASHEVLECRRTIEGALGPKRRVGF